MGKIKKMKIICLFFAMLFVVVACNEKDNSLKIINDVVFLKKKNNSNQEVYGVAYYLQANQGLNSVTVTLPISGQVVELKQDETNTYFFCRESSNEEFTTNLPVKGEYIFKVESKKGEYIEIIERQDFYDLPFIEIDSTNFDKNGPWFYVRWKDVHGADAYVAMLSKLSGEIIFSGYTFPADKQHDYKISDFHITGVWREKPVNGQRYLLKLNAIKYDDVAHKDNAYNTQEISETVLEITWQLD